MATWFFIFLALFATAKCQPMKQIGQTDISEAMANMRNQSYHGFAMLLQLLNSYPNFLKNTHELTFLMPSDTELSRVALKPEGLEDFVLSHSITTSLGIDHLLHFPNGTLVPSGVPKRMFAITRNGRSDVFVNNVRIVSPNVCLSSLISCHGINAAMALYGHDATIPIMSRLKIRNAENLKASARVNSQSPMTTHSMQP